ncbi:MAG: hypothetical protein OXC80_00605 [Gammaproteobacteria bacterium]|nr:hypothetical protein [Gammaproteobacteria bacterium]
MAQSSVSNGRFRFELNYRNLRGDEGLSIRVLGPVQSQDKELLRFDCFEKTPHYHIGVYDKNEITGISEQNPLEFALSHLDEDFSKMVEQSGGDALTEGEISSHQATIGNVRSEAERVITTAKAT